MNYYAKNPGSNLSTQRKTLLSERFGILEQRLRKEEAQSPEVNLPGSVHVLLNFHPWHFGLTLRGDSISEKYVCAFLSDSTNRTDLTNADLEALFTPGDPFRLYIQTGVPELPCPVLEGILNKRRPARESAAGGLHLEFTIETSIDGSQTADLAILLRELARHDQ